MAQHKLVRVRRGALETVKVSDAPPTWRDRVKLYYAKIFAVCSELVAVGNLMTPAFNYLPDHEKAFISAALVVLGVIVTVLNREKAWIEGH